MKLSRKVHFYFTALINAVSNILLHTLNSSQCVVRGSICLVFLIYMSFSSVSTNNVSERRHNSDVKVRILWKEVRTHMKFSCSHNSYMFFHPFLILFLSFFISSSLIRVIVFSSVLPSLIDRLGDAKDQVREQDQTLLLKIMEQATTPQVPVSHLCRVIVSVLRLVRVWSDTQPAFSTQNRCYASFCADSCNDA